MRLFPKEGPPFVVPDRKREASDGFESPEHLLSVFLVVAILVGVRW